MNQSKKTRNRWFHIPINQTDPKPMRAVKHLVNLILFVVSIPVTLIVLALGMAVLMFWFCLSTPRGYSAQTNQGRTETVKWAKSRGL